MTGGPVKTHFDAFMVKDGRQFITDADSPYAMDLTDRVVECDSTDAAITVTLPNVACAAGLIFAIYAQTFGSNITIQDQDESEDWTDVTLNGVDDGELLYSDGRRWWRLASRT